MRLPTKLAVAILACSAVLWGQRIIEYPIPVPNVPLSITQGPDGNLWFTLLNGTIGKVTTEGVFSEYSLPGPQIGQPYLQPITSGPDGNLWAGDLTTPRVFKITPSGVRTQVGIGGLLARGITQGPDGSLWIAQNLGSSGAIGKLSVSGTALTEYKVPGNSQPGSITVGPDGNLWFTDLIGKIGRITTDATITEFGVPSASPGPGITPGPGGALWFTESAAGKIGSITTSGIITEYAVPTASTLGGITQGPDGNLWFTETSANKIGMITPSGVFAEYAVPTQGSQPGPITVGPDGNLWFTEVAGNIGQVVLAQTPCTYSISPPGQLFTAAGGSGSFTVNTTDGCPWFVARSSDWVTVIDGSSGSGSGSVNFTVPPNGTGDLVGGITVAGWLFWIEQEASSIPGLNPIGSMPHLAAGGGWNTTFTFVNKSPMNATGVYNNARFSLSGDDGSPLTLPVGFPQRPLFGPLMGASLENVLGAGASLELQVGGSTDSPVLEGSAQLAADANVDGFAIFHYDPTNQEAVVPMETRNAPSYLLAFDNTNGVLTGVAMENVSSSGASVPVVIRDDAGNVVANSSVILNGQGHTSFVLSSQFPSTANTRGTIEFDTPGFGSSNAGQISVLGIRYTPPGTLTTIPALANVGTTGGAMAHIAVNNGWQTSFVLVNTGTSAASATLKFFGDDGSPLALPLTFPQGGAPVTAPTFTQSIGANASLWVQSAGAATAALQTGSAQLTTTGNVSGFVIFRYNTNGQEAVVPLESRAASSYIIAFDNTNGVATGVAISNAWGAAAVIPVTLRDGNGNTMGTSSVTLPANGHTSFVLGTQYPATAGVIGTAEFGVPSEGSISVLGIRSPPALTFTTLPALAK